MGSAGRRHVRSPQWASFSMTRRGLVMPVYPVGNADRDESNRARGTGGAPAPTTTHNFVFPDPPVTADGPTASFPPPTTHEPVLNTTHEPVSRPLAASPSGRGLRLPPAWLPAGPGQSQCRAVRACYHNQPHAADLAPAVTAHHAGRLADKQTGGGPTTMHESRGR